MADDNVPILLTEDRCVEPEEAGIVAPVRKSRTVSTVALGAVGLVAAALALAYGASDELRTVVLPAIQKKISTGRSCSSIGGVQLAEPDSKKSAWKSCSVKWTVDCTDTGCCADSGFKCYRKNKNWAACKADCKSKDYKNETWTCAVVLPPKPKTAERCFRECESAEDCSQAVFSSEGGGSCRFSATRIASVAWAADTKNSTFCGSAAEQPEIKKAMDSVVKQLPFKLTSERIKCSWGGEDCSKTQCCNDYLCDKNFAACNGFSCYKKTQYFSGCAAGPAADWDGKWLGGPREHRAIGPADSQVAVQGTSLYCFSVVTWDAPRPKPFWNSEAELANNWKQHGIHIMQCDGHDIYDGIQTPKAEWGSFSNIDLFMGIWDKVKANGRWKDYDWTVKVDADAVFIPSRLKDHLYNLRTPLGSRVYLENINFKFKFMGAIEIMTREALEVFLAEGHTCIRGKHEGGEDSFLKACFDGLGLDHQSDYNILHDKYAGLNPPCLDGWAVAYHYLKKTHDWSACYNEAMCGDAAENACDAAIPVPPDP